MTKGRLLFVRTPKRKRPAPCWPGPSRAELRTEAQKLVAEFRGKVRRIEKRGRRAAAPRPDDQC
jgi:hypothetical protein